MTIDISWVTRSIGMVRRSAYVMTPLVFIFLLPQAEHLISFFHIRSEVVIAVLLSIVSTMIVLFNTLGRDKSYITIITPLCFSVFFLTLSFILYRHIVKDDNNSDPFYWPFLFILGLGILANINGLFHNLKLNSIPMKPFYTPAAAALTSIDAIAPRITSLWGLQLKRQGFYWSGLAGGVILLILLFLIFGGLFQGIFVVLDKLNPLKELDAFARLDPLTQVNVLLACNFVLLLIAFRFIGRFMSPMIDAVRRKRADATTVLELDLRSPVLLLRSFVDDHFAPEEGSQFTFEFLPSSRPRLENIVYDKMQRLGSLTAIGAPKEPIPLLGAFKAYPADDDWQAWVITYMQKARYVVLVVGTTEWLRWELSKLAELDFLGKTILMIPSASNSDWNERWGVLCSTLHGHGVNIECKTESRGKVRALVFPSGLMPILIQSETVSAIDFEVTLQTAIYVISNPQQIC